MKLGLWDSNTGRFPLHFVVGFLLFIATVLVGCFTYKDYGIAWDEPAQHLVGSVNYDYVFNHSDSLLSFKDRVYGPAFEMPLIFLEKSMHLTDSRDIYFARHLFTHLFFLSGCFVFFLLVFGVTRNLAASVFAWLMLILNPRIYAHSFFNSKDIPFLTSIILLMWLTTIAFQRRNKFVFALLGLVAGYAAGIRIIGVMHAVLIIAMLNLDVLFNNNGKAKRKDALLNLAFFGAAFIITFYSVFPYLWHDTFSRVAEIFAQMSHFQLGGTVLLNGVSYDITEIPASYFPVWFLISNPVTQLLCGFAGICFLIFRLVSKRKQFFLEENSRFVIFTLACFVLPIFIVLALHATLYDDWRHLYFIYPAFILVGAYLITSIRKPIVQYMIYGILAIDFGLTAWFMIKNHPYQEVYFNNCISHTDESLRSNFDLDYWGLCHREGLEYLIENEKQYPIQLACNLNAPVAINKLILKPEDRDKIQIVDFLHADYFITEYRGHPGDYPSSNVIYTIKVENSTIMAIYKLDEKDRPHH